MAIDYEAVCLNSEQRLAAGLSQRQADVFVTPVIAMAEPRNIFLWRPQLRDPKGEMMLEAAVNGRADALVKFNMRHYREAQPFWCAASTTANHYREDQAMKREWISPLSIRSCGPGRQDTP